MTLAPEIQQYLQMRATAGGPEVWQVPVSSLRRASYGRIISAGDAMPLFSVTDRYIPGPTSDLHIRIYRPNNSAPLPALVYFHGGGWVLNSLDIYDAELSAFAETTGSVVIAVNYQKAPEHPYPIPFDDCHATYLWVHENAVTLGINEKKIGVGGESAGGNLAAAVALKIRDTQGPAIAYQLIINPCNERNFESPSYIKYSSGYGLSRQAMQWYWDQYLQGPQYDQDPYACPNTARDFSQLPRAIIVTAECDPLKDDGTKYERLLRKSGVRTHYKEYPGMIHGFVNLGAITPMAHQAILDCAEIIRKIVN